jgi:hypothetical protein
MRQFVAWRKVMEVTKVMEVMQARSHPNGFGERTIEASAVP